MGAWTGRDCGVLVALPSGRQVRARELRRDAAPRELPEFGVYLSEIDPRLHAWPGPYEWVAEWVRWPRHGLPRDRAAFAAVVQQAWRRCADERVEVASVDGTARIGLTLACLAVLDGAPPVGAIRAVKAQYENWTVATLPQRLFLTRFADLLSLQAR